MNFKAWWSEFKPKGDVSGIASHIWDWSSRLVPVAVIVAGVLGISMPTANDLFHHPAVYVATAFCLIVVTWRSAIAYERSRGPRLSLPCEFSINSESTIDLPVTIEARRMEMYRVRIYVTRVCRDDGSTISDFDVEPSVFWRGHDAKFDSANIRNGDEKMAMIFKKSGDSIEVLTRSLTDGITTKSIVVPASCSLSLCLQITSAGAIPAVLARYRRRYLIKGSTITPRGRWENL